MDKEEKMREVDPMTTPRAKSWQLYKDAPMPMVTIFKTLDVSPLVRLKESGYRFNMLMCFCTAQAVNIPALVTPLSGHLETAIPE